MRFLECCRRAETEFVPEGYNAERVQKWLNELPLLVPNHFDVIKGDFTREHIPELQRLLLPREGYIGEVKLPIPLEEFGILSGMLSYGTVNGAGHGRIQNYQERTGQIVNIPTRNFSFGQTELSKLFPKTNSFFMADADAYNFESLVTAVRNGMVDQETAARYKRRVTTWGVMHDLFGMVQRKKAKRYMSGNTWGQPVEEILREMQLLGRILGNEVDRKVNNGDRGVAHIIFHPMFNTLLPKRPGTITVGTDALLVPSWFNPGHHIYVETVEAAEAIINAWKHFYANVTNEVHVTGGFPLPPSGYVTHKLTECRAENACRPLRGKEAPILAFWHSGAALSQVGTFASALEALAPRIAAGEFQVFIQTGFGFIGGLAFEKMHKLAQELDTKYPGFMAQTQIHWGRNVDEATKTYEAISTTVLPIINWVKGGELIRVGSGENRQTALSGALGVHEIFNVGTSLRQGAPLLFTPQVFRQLQQHIAEFGIVIDRGLQRLFEEAVRPSPSAVVDELIDHARSGQVVANERGVAINIAALMAQAVAV